jgi:hypothetical protein
LIVHLDSSLSWLSTATPTVASSHNLLPLLALLVLLVILPLIVFFAWHKIKKPLRTPAESIMMESDVYKTMVLPDHYDRIPTVFNGSLSTATAEKGYFGLSKADESSTDVPTTYLSLKILPLPAAVEQNSYVNTELIMTESAAYRSLPNLQANGSTTSNCAGAASSVGNSTPPSSEAVASYSGCQTESGILDHSIYLPIKSDHMSQQAVNLPNTVFGHCGPSVNVQRDAGEFRGQPPLNVDDEKHLIDDRLGENGEENNFHVLLPPAEFIDSVGLQPVDIRHAHEANMEAADLDGDIKCTAAEEEVSEII